MNALAAANNKKLLGIFAEIYDPYRVGHYEFGGVKPMDPYVRREVLSHLGYRRLDFQYVHPSWNNDGEAITGLDLCFLPMDGEINELQTDLIVKFLKRYYAVLSNKPDSWHTMVENLEAKEKVTLLYL